MAQYVEPYVGYSVLLCVHEELDQEWKWLETASPSYLALKNVVENKMFLMDIKYLSKFCHKV